MSSARALKTSRRLESLFSPKAKQVMTSFDLATIVHELNETLIGSRIDNIYQISPLALLLVFNPRQRLIIEAGRRIHLTEYEVKKPNSPSLFCRILRKFFNNGTVQGVQMDDFERVVSFEVESKGENHRLVCEIFGKGNIILADSVGVILHALSYRRMRSREIIRGETLKPPPSRGYSPLKITRKEFDSLQEQQGEIVQALSKLLAIGGLYVEELLLRANVEKRRTVSSLTKEEVDRIYDEVLNLASDLARKEPHIVLDERGRLMEVLPFPLKTYSGFKTENYPTYNRAADEYFIKLPSEGGNSASEEAVQDIDEQKRILNQQKESLESLIHAADEKRRIGDTIYLHLLKLQDLLQQIKEDRSKSIRWEEIVSELSKQKDRDEEASVVVASSIDPAKGVLTIKIDNLSFELNLRQSIFENAASFYEEAKKLEAKVEGIKKAIAETEEKIEDLNKAQLLRLESEKEVLPVKIKARSWFEKFHWVKSSENFLIVGGRDASTNELLVKKYVDADDLIFHADIGGAPFVVLKTGDKVPTNQTIFEAAQLAASYSRAWGEGYTSLDVYWVKPEQVSKQAPSGEFLSKGMFMVRGQKNYIRNVPLRISIGVMEEEEELLVIGGPVSAVNRQARYIVEVVPGKQASGMIAKIIRDNLATNATKEYRERILKLKIEEFQRFIPPGKSEIAIR